MRARDNPFASDRILTVRYKPRDWTWDQLLGRLQALNYSAAIVGPQGSGKTTLLEDLETPLRARGFVPLWVRLDREHYALSAEQRAWCAALESRDVRLLNGAEQLNWLRWRQLRRLARRAGGMIITTHYPGPLPTLITTFTSVPLLEQIVAELAPARNRQPMHALFHRHSGNLRECLRELYDNAAGGSAQ